GAAIDLCLVEEFHDTRDNDKKGAGVAPAPVRLARNGTGYSAAAGAGNGLTDTCTRSSARRSNFTVPSISANSVGSRPRPTLRPGFTLVPRCRMMMLPARTAWPPDFLTPRRRPSVSRPLRDEPPAFL